MNYDQMGSYYGAVNDMLDTNTEANVKPVTQTITTDPRTGEQMMTIKGRPDDLSANNPNTPTVTQPTPAPAPQPNQYLNLANSASMQPVGYQPPPAPVAPQQPPVQQAPVPQMAPPAGPQTMPQGGPPAVGATRQPLMAPPSQPPAPDQTYQRMIQAESGGQNYAPNGQPLTSPAGAMFAAQVMPSTAQNPGYGVRPAASQTPEEYNRVGQDYYNAMLNKFGNPTAAAAAYNAGPGRVQQNLAANNGQLNVGQLPQETQVYLQKVTPDQRYAADFVKAQDNPAELSRLRYDQNAPEWVRTVASQRELQDLRHKDETVKVEQKIKTAIENNDGRTIANMMNPRGKEKDEGSIAKAFLFSLIGFQSGAQAEVEKMGLKDKWDIARLGNDDVTVKYNPRGEAREAIYTSGANAGQRVSDADLEMLHGQGAAAGKGKADVSTQDVERNGVAGRVVTEHRGGRTQTYVESGGQRFAYDTSWQPRSIATSAAKADYGLITDLRKKFGTDAIGAMTEYQKYKGPMSAPDRDAFLQAYGFNAAAPTGQTPPPAQLPPVNVPGAGPVAPGAPSQSQQNQAPGAGTNMRTAPGPVAPTPVNAQPPATAPAGAPSNLTTPIAQLETEQKGATQTATVVGEDIGKVKAALPQAERTAESMLKTIDDVVTHPGFETNVGVRGPSGILQLRGTEARGWESKYKQLIGQQFLVAYNQLKGGGAISDVEGAKAEEAIAALKDKGISETEFKRNTEILKTIIKNGINDQRKKVGLEPKYSIGETGTTGVTPTPVPTAPKAGTTKTINGVTYEYDGRGWKKSAGV